MTMSSGSSLLWRCRRGIREMDLLLQYFIEKRFDLLTNEEKDAFEQLLEQQDLDIMAWIMGRAEPPNEQIRHLIEIIREINLPQSVNSDK
ncbi:MAG: succinate dehydrogenase assembly factor 2 family protein [Gammaproteobacteria bacterium]|nr:succinate dehydrogenase assembly factor 2 family protein [Gammaproteobacteria bacterium]